MMTVSSVSYRFIHAGNHKWSEQAMIMAHSAGMIACCSISDDRLECSQPSQISKNFISQPLSDQYWLG